MGTPPAQHERLTEASSKLREPILICPDALESSETIFSASIFLRVFPRQISCQWELSVLSDHVRVLRETGTKKRQIISSLASWIGWLEWSDCFQNLNL